MKLILSHRQFRIGFQNPDTSFSSRQKLLLALFFLTGLNFMNLFYYLVFAAAAVFFLTYYKSIRIPRELISILGLALSLLFFSPNAFASFESLLKPLSYPFCVLMC